MLYEPMITFNGPPTALQIWIILAMLLIVIVMLFSDYLGNSEDKSSDDEEGV